jgi:transformation/transcription domain-associated protein
MQLTDVLNLFVRDEVLAWLATAQRPAQAGPTVEPPLRDRVSHNVELVQARIRALACLPSPDRVRPAPPPASRTYAGRPWSDRGTAGMWQAPPTASQPVHQQILRLITAATNPQQLSQMDPTWHPWL